MPHLPHYKAIKSNVKNILAPAPVTRGQVILREYYYEKRKVL